MKRMGARGLMGAALAVVVAGVTAGPAVALAPLVWSAPRAVDVAAPFGHAAGLSQVTCPSVSLCVSIASSAGPYPGPQGRVLTSVNPTSGSAWRAAQVDPDRLSAISCPSVSLCVVVDGYGGIVTSTNPVQGAATWSSRVVPAGGGTQWRAVSCPSVSLCVATADGGRIFVSTDPTGGASAWSESSPLPTSARVSCPLETLCFSLPYPGGSFMTRDPSGNRPWMTVPADGQNRPQAVSCPSTQLCVAVDNAGNAAVSTDPTSSTPHWSVTAIDAAPLVSVSCPTEKLCAAVDQEGGLVTSTNPGGGTGAWSPVSNVDPNGATLSEGAPIVAPGPAVPLAPTGSPDVTGVSCASTMLCVAVDAYGHAITSMNPTGGASAWQAKFAALPVDAFATLSCPSRALCAALDDAGRVVATTTPGSSRRGWTVNAVAGLGGAYWEKIRCTRRPFCFASDTSYGGGESARAFGSIDPTGGPAAWKSVGSLQFPGRTCAWKRLCVGYTNTGFVVSSRSKSAKRRSGPFVPYAGTSCPGAFCIAPTGVAGGQVLISTHPLNSASWKSSATDTAPSPTLSGANARVLAVSCPSRTLCVAVDDAGNIVYSHHPTRGTRAWRSIHPKLPADLTLLSCPSTSLCVGADSLGDIVNSTDPTGPASTWSVRRLETDSYITALDCPSASLCVAGDEAGRVLTGTAPVHITRRPRPRS